MPYGRYARRSRSGGRRGARSFRRPVWIRSINTPTAVPVAQSVVGIDLLPQGSPPTDVGLDRGARVGSTIMRVRGSVAYVNTGVSSMNVAWFVFGITVCSEVATPNPYTEVANWQWLYWGIHMPEQGAILVTNGTENSWAREFDVKAKRIITQPGETLKASIAWPHATAANFHDYNVTTSTLLKLA